VARIGFGGVIRKRLQVILDYFHSQVLHFFWSRGPSNDESGLSSLLFSSPARVQPLGESPGFGKKMFRKDHEYINWVSITKKIILVLNTYYGLLSCRCKRSASRMKTGN